MIDTFYTDTFRAAALRYAHDPQTLTDADLAQFEIISPVFAEKARQKRAGIDALHTPELQREITLADALRLHDVVEPYLLHSFWRIRESMSRIDALERELAELKAKSHDPDGYALEGVAR